MNNLKKWFKCLSARKKFNNDFNRSAAKSFITGLSTPYLLNAKSKFGNTENSNECALPLFRTGFCLKVAAGRELSGNELQQIGESEILSDTVLTRKLFVLGYGTLIIKSMKGRELVRLKIKDYIKGLPPSK